MMREQRKAIQGTSVKNKSLKYNGNQRNSPVKRKAVQNLLIKQESVEDQTLRKYVPVLSPYSCDKCSYKCKKFELLECHKINHIEEPFPILTSYSCNLCNKKFRKFSRLHLHKLQTHKIKPNINNDSEKLVMSHEIPVKSSKQSKTLFTPRNMTNTSEDCEVLLRSHKILQNSTKRYKILPNDTQNNDYGDFSENFYMTHDDYEILKSRETEDYTESNKIKCDDYQTFNKLNNPRNDTSDDGFTQNTSDNDYDTHNSMLNDGENKETFLKTYKKEEPNDYKIIPIEQQDTDDNCKKPHKSQNNTSSEETLKNTTQSKEHNVSVPKNRFEPVKVQNNDNKISSVRKCLGNINKNKTLVKKRTFKSIENESNANNTPAKGKIGDVVSETESTKDDKNVIEKEESEQKQNVEIKYACSCCGYKAKKKSILTTHMLKHSGYQPYTCNQCEYKTCWTSALKRHVKTHTTDNVVKPHACDSCDYRTDQSGNLKRHMNVHIRIKCIPHRKNNTSVDGIRKCDKCGFKTSKNSIFKAHFKSQCKFKIMSNLNQLYICDTCGYKSSTRLRLIYHLQKHSTDMPYSCNECKFKCKRSETFERHMHIHKTPAVSLTSYCCNICGKRFRIHSRFEKHMHKHECQQGTLNMNNLHGTVNMAKFELCTLCDYKCKRKYDLTKHMRSHTGEKPYECEMCSYKCTTGSHLITHMRKHTGERPYTCQVCGFSFNQTGSLQRHMKLGHSKPEFI